MTTWVARDNAFGRLDEAHAPFRRFGSPGFIYVYELMRRGTPSFVPSLHKDNPVRMSHGSCIEILRQRLEAE